MALLLLGGTWAAVLALSGRIGAQRRTPGKIESLIYYPELRVLEISLLLEEGWAGHAASISAISGHVKSGLGPALASRRLSRA